MIIKQPIKLIFLTSFLFTINTSAQKILNFYNENRDNYASMNIYSGQTGEFERYYLKNQTWEKDTNIPQLPINITKNNIHMEFVEETRDSYASMNIYSGQTGEFERYYLKNQTWEKDTNIPQLPINITKNNIHMEFVEETQDSYASMNIYSGQTGEFERYYLKNQTWEKDTNIPQPPINITKNNIHMEFVEETRDSYASMNIYSGQTGEFERYYLKNQTWEKDTNIPQLPINITKNNIHMEFVEETRDSYASMNIYSGQTGEFERYYLKNQTWEKDTNIPQLPINITKNNIHMEFVEETRDSYASMNIYSGQTGEFERYYLKNNIWEKDSSIPETIKL